MYNTSFIKKTLLAASVAFFYSCDKDFNSLGEELIGENHFGLQQELYEVKAYNQKVTPVASNNLAVNALGIYDNPVFGTTTANFNTQVTLNGNGTQLGFNVAIDSVTLHIPYFSTVKNYNTDGSKTYVLDSIYGPATGKLKLSVYESGIFLNDYKADDPNSRKFYYTDKNSEFKAKAEAIRGRLNNSSNIAENDDFFFSSKEIKEVTAKTETTAENITYIKPEMRLHLDTLYFRNKIFNAPTGVLSAPDVFKNYFKGLYFHVENAGNAPGRMAMLNFAEGKIKIFYKAKNAADDKDKVSKTLEIALTGNTTSLLQESNLNPKYTAATADDQTADEKLYLKGGQGSMAIVELTELGEQLEAIRDKVASKEWMINEANLIFYVDETVMSATETKAPDRIYLYDANYNTPLRDYLTDGSTIGGSEKRNKGIFDGMLQTIKVNNVTSQVYKIRITDYIRNLLKNKEAVNVKLGLTITEDIRISTSNKLDPTQLKSNTFTEIPTASVMSPLGTVLFGGTSASGDKKVKLQVYYTKIN
jgi:hypothetical protein